MRRGNLVYLVLSVNRLEGVHDIQDERGVLCPAPDPGWLLLWRLLPLEEPRGSGGRLLDFKVLQGAGSDTARLGCRRFMERAYPTTRVFLWTSSLGDFPVLQQSLGVLYL